MITLEQEQLTYSIETEGRYFSMIRTTNTNIGCTEITVLEDGEPVKDVALLDRLEEIYNVTHFTD